MFSLVYPYLVDISHDWICTFYEREFLIEFMTALSCRNVFVMAK